jgi:hypothetical protein
MHIQGNTRVHKDLRILEISREGDHILMNIHHPGGVNVGEKIRLTVDVATRALEAIDAIGPVTLHGRMRKAKVIDVGRDREDAGTLWLWIRGADAGPTDGWEIFIHPDSARRALHQAVSG